MRNTIKEYLDLTETEKQNLWENATIIFDTNVFLNLYRYTSKTREILFLALDNFKDRLWMPNHIAHEFMKNRSSIIWESNHHYESLHSEAKKFIDLCRSELKLDADDKNLNELKTQMEEWINIAKRKNLLVSKPCEDEILEKLLDLFDGKVGAAFSEEDLKKIELEGKMRYATKTPPGYKDSEKQKGDNLNNVYGDLIVWKEILNYASSEKKDIILVTNDQKEDWWETLHNQTLGPRIELKREFIKNTSQKFHMYSMKSFITRFENGRNVKIDRDTIDEIEFFSNVIHHKTSRKTLKNYYLSLGSDDEAKAAKIRFEIMRLENKNKKRIAVVEQNREKYLSEKMPDTIATMVENNIANIEKDSARIEMLKVELQQYTT